MKLGHARSLRVPEAIKARMAFSSADNGDGEAAGAGVLAGEAACTIFTEKSAPVIAKAMSQDLVMRVSRSFTRAMLYYGWVTSNHAHR